MQATEQYFPVEMLISMNNLTWESVNENPAARQVLSPRTFFLKVFQEILDTLESERSYEGL